MRAAHTEHVQIMSISGTVCDVTPSRAREVRKSADIFSQGLNFPDDVFELKLRRTGEDAFVLQEASAVIFSSSHCSRLALNYFQHVLQQFAVFKTPCLLF